MLAADSRSVVLIVTFDQLNASVTLSNNRPTLILVKPLHRPAPSASNRWRIGVWKEELGLGPFGDIEHPDVELGLHNRVTTFAM